MRPGGDSGGWDCPCPRPFPSPSQRDREESPSNRASDDRDGEMGARGPREVRQHVGNVVPGAAVLWGVLNRDTRPSPMMLAPWTSEAVGQDCRAGGVHRDISEREHSGKELDLNTVTPDSDGEASRGSGTRLRAGLPYWGQTTPAALHPDPSGRTWPRVGPRAQEPWHLKALCGPLASR